jgi:hypothetical protein
MKTSILKPLLVLALLCPAAAAQQPQAPDKKARGFKADLTAATWADVHKLVRPHEDEWRHLRVKWLTDVTAARQKAATEDKPIVICYTGGAGYNEPLGVC